MKQIGLVLLIRIKIFNNSRIIFKSHDLVYTECEIVLRHCSIVHLHINNNRKEVYEIEAKKNYENPVEELVETIYFISFERILFIELIVYISEVSHRIIMLNCKSVNLNGQSEEHKKLSQHYVILFIFKYISHVSLGHYC